jgi:hypothetical protein
MAVLVGAGLILALVVLLAGCRSYFQTSSYPTEGDEAITRLNQTIAENRYFVIVAGQERFHGANPRIVGHALELDVAPLSSERQALHQLVDERGGTRYRRSTERGITKEVRLHLTPGITVDHGPRTLALSDIQRIDVYDVNTGATVASHALGFVGYTVATMVVLVAIVAATKDSCPFVYTWDGEAYSIAGEIYGGAISSPLERSDYLALPDLTAVEGYYHLRIANELKERQYINLTELVAVSYPRGTRVVFDKHGTVHTIEEPRLAVVATSSAGIDYADALAAPNHDVFRFDDGGEDVGSITLTFPRPGGAASGKLVVHAKASHWLDYVFDRYTEQFGVLYNRWAARIARRSTEELQEWNLSQSLPLQVFVETADGWRFVDHFDMVGPLFGTRELVLPLDLRDVEGDEVRVRIETGFAFWELDAAAIDYSTNRPAQVAHVKPQRATTLEGEDVRELLSGDDGQYLRQFEIGDAVNLYYPAQQAGAGEELAIFLHAKGYYEPIREYSGIPNVPRLLSFREPGRFTAFARERYIEYLEGLSAPAPVAGLAR